MHADLYDLHVYVLHTSVIELLAKNKSQFTSVKNELLPFLIKHQFDVPKEPKGSNVEQEDQLQDEDPIDYSHSHPAKEGLCYAVVSPATTFSLRVNTVQSLLEASKEVAVLLFIF